MKVHIIGNKGIVGSATQRTLELSSQHIVTGSDLGEQVDPHSDVYLICVPEAAVSDIMANRFLSSKGRGLIIVRSTVRPDIITNLGDNFGHFCTNPEFLKAHTSFWDSYYPKGILIGQCCEKHGQIVEEVWNFLNVPFFIMTREEASMVKLSSNVHAAMVITLWNSLLPISKKLGINLFQVARNIVGLDERVGRYGTIPGTAYGGACLPKDMRQMIDMCKDNGEDTSFLDIIEAINSKLEESTISRGAL